MPCGYKKNPELGILPLVAAAAAPMALKAVGGVGKALGGLFKKKKKKGAAPAAPAAQAATTPQKAEFAAARAPLASDAASNGARGHGKKKKAVKGTAKKQLSTSDVVKALQTYKAQELAKKQANRDTLKTTLGPTLNAITELTKKAAISKQATNEHNRRMLEANRWLKVDQQHQQILSKLGELSQAIVTDKVNKARIFSIYGVNP